MKYGIIVALGRPRHKVNIFIDVFRPVYEFSLILHERFPLQQFVNDLNVGGFRLLLLSPASKFPSLLDLFREFLLYQFGSRNDRDLPSSLFIELAPK